MAVVTTQRWEEVGWNRSPPCRCRETMGSIKFDELKKKKTLKCKDILLDLLGYMPEGEETKWKQLVSGNGTGDQRIVLL